MIRRCRFGFFAGMMLFAGACYGASPPGRELDAGLDASSSPDFGSLASLVSSVGALSPVFAPSTTMYTLDVPPGTTAITLTLDVADPTRATIRLDGAIVAARTPSPEIALLGPATEVTIVITTDAGETRTYSIVVRVDSSTYIKASNTDAGDWFGWAVAISGDGATLAVGAWDEDSSATGVDGDQTSNGTWDSGAVYIFTRVGTSWMQQAYLKASDTERNGQFGGFLSLSADGSTLAVGAPTESSEAVGVPPDDFSGAVYVFTRVGVSWSQQAYIKAFNTNANDFFGWSVALSADGSTLAVGAYPEASNAVGIDGDGANNDAPSSGAVYVFTRVGASWLQQAYVKASNTEPNDYFGRALALSGDGSTLVVGAKYEDSRATGVGGDQSNNEMTDAGAVYVFARTGATWSQQAYVKASNPGAGDGFGDFVAVSADGATFAVGALYEPSSARGIDGNQADETAPEAGAVYVFTRAGGTWTQQAYVKPSNTNAHQYFSFGLALSADGSTLAVGAPWEASSATGIDGDQTDNSLVRAGAVYVFTRIDAVWAQQAYVKASNPDSEDHFGIAVALSADGATLVVGAHIEASSATGVGGDQSDDTAPAAGAVYLY